MSEAYRAFFGFERRPFPSNLPVSDILLTEELSAAWNRFEYAVGMGAATLVTGEVGSGKSTALRYMLDRLHPSEYRYFSVTATSGSILELYRQLLGEMGVETASSSRAVLTGRIKKEIEEWVRNKKMKVLLVIDEASLLRLEVFKELHTLLQFDFDSDPILPLVLAGQSNLVDKLSYRSSHPFASRIVGRSHLDGMDRETMEKYIDHRLSIAGTKTRIYDDAAITAIHQGSGGVFRKANHLARGALVAAALEKSTAVTAEHVRLASTELF